MRISKNVSYFLLIGLLLIALTACTREAPETPPTVEAPETMENERQETPAEKIPYDQDFVMESYEDYNELRNGEYYVLGPNRFDPAKLWTYSFSDRVTFQGAEDLAAQVLEQGKNPGLGIRALHEAGITGEGINVAIIDQNLGTDHPEYASRIAAYYDTGCETLEESSSMHGPAVLSILAGETLGVAPGVNVYFAAAPSWKADAAYFADGLNWILDQNEQLPEGEKIRVVSVSAAPENGPRNDWFTNGELWEEAVERAEEAGILVIDCRSDYDTGFVFSSCCNWESPDDVTRAKPGYPLDKLINYREGYEKMIFAPSSYRTTAQEYQAGDPFYCFWPHGGRSWAVPYVAGVLALGFQVNPDLDAATAKSLLYESCWVNAQGNHMLNPAAFIELVQETT